MMLGRASQAAVRAYGRGMALHGGGSRKPSLGHLGSEGRVGVGRGHFRGRAQQVQSPQVGQSTTFQDLKEARRWRAEREEGHGRGAGSEQRASLLRVL